MSLPVLGTVPDGDGDVAGDFEPELMLGQGPR